MPNITQYSNPDTSIDTSGFTQAARRIGAFATQEAGTVQEQGRQLGQGIDRGAQEVGKTVEEHVDYWDQTRVLSQKTAILATAEQKWQSLLKGTPDPDNPGKYLVPPADPTDKDLANRFMKDEVEPALTDLQKTPIGLHGATFAANSAGEIRQHLQTALTADMSTLAGKAVQISDERVKNNSAALIAADPSFHNVDMALKTMDQLNVAHSSVGSITADVAATLKMHNEAGKEELVHTAIAAAIERSGNPEQVVKDFTAKYPEYVKPAQEIALAKAARNQMKFNASLDRAEEAQFREKAKLQWDKLANDRHMSIVQPDGSIGVAGPEYFQGLKADIQKATVLNKDGTVRYAPPSGETAALMQFGQNHDGEDRTYTNPAAMKEITNAMIADPEQARIDIVKMNNAGLISDKNTGRLLQNAQILSGIGEHDEKVKTVMHAADTALTYTMPGLPGKDPKGAIAYANFVNDFLPAYAEAVKKHDLPPNALDFSDPKSMVSMYLNKWQRSPSQMLADRMAELGALGGQTPFDQAKNAGTLQRSPSTGLLKDTVTGKVFNPDGTEHK